MPAIPPATFSTHQERSSTLCRVRRTALAIEEMSFLPSEPIPLEPGDMLLMATDGVCEARSPEDVEFGNERFLEVVRENHHRPAEEIITSLLKRSRIIAAARGSRMTTADH